MSFTTYKREGSLCLSFLLIRLTSSLLSLRLRLAIPTRLEGGANEAKAVISVGEKGEREEEREEQQGELKLPLFLSPFATRPPVSHKSAYIHTAKGIRQIWQRQRCLPL